MENASRIIESTNSEGIKALEDFLLDIQCLERLGKWTVTNNLFDVL